MSISVHVLPDPLEMCGDEKRQVQVTFKGAAPGKVHLRLSAGGSCTLDGGVILRSKTALGAGTFHVTTGVRCRCLKPTTVVNTSVTAVVTDDNGGSGQDSAPLRYGCSC